MSSNNRLFWNRTSDDYQRQNGAALDRAPLAWGVWRIPESEISALEPVEGRRVLELGCGAAQWTPVAKDGATLPEEACAPVPARQTIAVGETYDFAVDVPPGRRTYWLEVRTPAGRWQLQAHVIGK